MRRSLRLSLVAGIMACGSSEGPITAPPQDPHAAAIAYLDSAITLMQTKAFYRRRVKWDSVRANAHVGAAAALSPAETYGAIRQALLALGDHHSFLFPAPSAALGSEAVAGHRIDSIGGELLNGKFGYVHVPTFSPLVAGANGPALTDSLQSLIRIVDGSNPCGWVVDLRHNGGGNMWPMLAGIGPILGNDEHLGSFVDADSTISTWYYNAGISGYVVGSQRLVLGQGTRPAYVLRHPNPPVAVLTDSLTASSGEAVVVAFRGLARARSFGGATAGVPTANQGFTLSDRAQLFLMVALDADRNGTWYSQRIPADVPMFLSTYPTTDDAIVTAALGWLGQQQVCAG
jgi:hypothetical protein